MRTILILLVVGLMTTTGIYAASMVGTIAWLGGTGELEIQAPTTDVIDISYTFTGILVTGVDVSWTPTVNSDYEIDAKVNDSTGQTTVTGSGTGSRTDSVAISPSVNASQATKLEVVINEN